MGPVDNAPHDTKHDLPHEGPIKTPKQLVITLVFAFVVPVVVIILLVTYVATATRTGAGSDGMSPEAVARRIQPVGTVEVRDLSDPASLRSGEQVYAAQCVACHGTGAAGAPKLGDTAAWAPRLRSGYEALLEAALKGKGAMGPQGGGDFTDFEIGRAVVHLANQSGGKLAEPKAPATAVQTAAAATDRPAATAPATDPSAVAAAVAAATPKAEPSAAAGAAAQALYAQSCQVCHAAGVAGAPKLGDKAAWGPRLAQGLDAMTASVIKGKGAMPPRGGSTATDAELKAVVDYMVATVK